MHACFIDNSTLLATKCVQLLRNHLSLVFVLCTEIEIDDCVSEIYPLLLSWKVGMNPENFFCGKAKLQ